MATIIDKLTVLLNIDNTSFKKGIKESEREKDTFEGKNKKFDKQRAEAEKKSELRKETFQKKDMARNRQTIDGFAKLRNEAIAFLTIFTAGKGILSFVSDTITTTAAMGRLSDNIGVSVKDLSGLKFAFQEVGGSANDASVAIQKAADAAASSGTGMANSTYTGMITLSGGTGINVAAAAKVGTKAFLMAEADVLNILSKKVGRNKALSMYKHLAGGDDNSFNVLTQGSMGLSQQMMKGAALSGDNGARAKASERMQRQWVEISTRMESVGKTLMFKIAPIVFKMLDRLTSWIANKENMKIITGYMDDFSKAINGMNTGNLDGIGIAFHDIAVSLGLIGTALKTINDIGGGTGSLVAKVFNPTEEDSPAALAASNKRLINKFGIRGAGAGTSNSTSSSVATQNNTFHIQGNDAHSIADTVRIKLGMANSGM